MLNTYNGCPIPNTDQIFRLNWAAFGVGKGSADGAFERSDASVLDFGSRYSALGPPSPRSRRRLMAFGCLAGNRPRTLLIDRFVVLAQPPIIRSS